MSKQVKKEASKAEILSAKVITAINKIEGTLSSIPQRIEDVNTLKIEAEKIKADLTLGLATYEADINESKAKLDEELQARVEEVQEELKSLDQGVKDKIASNKRAIEELSYEHKKAIEREDLETAKVIVAKYDKIVADNDILEQHDKAKAEEIKALEILHKEELNENSKGYAIAENKIKSQLRELEIELTTKLEAANNTILNQKEQIEYLQKELQSQREANVEAVKAAANSKATVINENATRK